MLKNRVATRLTCRTFLQLNDATNTDIISRRLSEVSYTCTGEIDFELCSSEREACPDLGEPSYTQSSP